MVISIRVKLRGGKTTIGSWMQLANADVAEMMGDAGFDWICVDMEHSTITRSDLPDLFRAISLGGTTPIVRLKVSDPDLATEALEAGAEGIIAPNIYDPDQVRELKNAMRYPPKGFRGLGYCRGNGYGKYYKDNLDFDPLIIPMIENATAIPMIPFIFQEGVDALFIGPYDLSASLGIAGQFENTAYTHALDQIKFYCKEYKVPLGIHQIEPDREALDRLRDEGFRFISYSGDILMLQNHLKDLDLE